MLANLATAELSNGRMKSASVKFRASVTFRIPERYFGTFVVDLTSLEDERLYAMNISEVDAGHRIIVVSVTSDSESAWRFDDVFTNGILVQKYGSHIRGKSLPSVVG
jgi:hypothetical protein